MPSDEELAKELANWLNEGGFPLEMRTGRTIIGYEPDTYGHSQYYADPNTGELRETDIVASWANIHEDGSHIWNHLAIECKSGDGIWIFFKHENADYGRPPRSVVALNSVMLNLPIGKPDVVQYIGSPLPKLLQGEHTPSYGVVQKKKEGGGKDHAYAATRQAASSAYGVARATPIADNVLQASRCFPLVVTSCRLFVAQLDKSGEVEVKATSRETVLVPSPTTGEQQMIEVYVVNESALSDFMDDFTELIKGLADPTNVRPLQ